MGNNMYILNDKLAINAIPQTNEDMFYVDAVVGDIDGFKIVDVRMLKNRHPNPDEEYMLNIIRATSWLQCDEKVVICSSAAKSRSLAIALGVLVKYFKMNFYDALKLVIEKVQVAQIDDIHLDSLKKLLDVS